MAAQLAALKKVRATIKGSFTKMDNFVTGLPERDDVSVDELKIRLSAVNDLKAQFNDTEAKIFNCDPEVESQMSDIEDKYYSICARLTQWIRKLGENKIPVTNESVLNITQNAFAEIKMKKLSIPQFSGNYTEWQSFFDIYNSSIHEKEYPAVQKFQYLKSLLTGEAAKLITHFSITEANYYEAYSKLVERYDRKKYIINAFIRTFVEQPAVTQVNVSNIRRLRDTSDEVLRGLKALDPRAETRDCWLIYILLKKLDNETRMLWAQESTTTDYPTVKEFLEFLNKRCDALETMDSYTRSKPSSHVKTMVTETSSSKSNSCSVCSEGNHLLYECDQFRKMALGKRKAIISSNGRCFNCLHKGHNVAKCYARSRCQTCYRKHHTLLHEDVPDKGASKNIEARVLQQESETQVKQTQPKQEVSGNKKFVNMQTSIPLGVRIILPTAVVRVKTSWGELRLCRALLDSASQVTFITEACVQKLGLSKRNGRVLLSGLGQRDLGRTNGMTDLEIMPRSRPQPIYNVEAYVVPKITALQSVGDLNKDIFEIVKERELADPKFYEAGNIDILLGVEVFFKIIEGQQIKCSPQLIVQNTKLGWVIGGSINNEIVPNNVINFNINLNIDEALRKFWEVEDIPVTTNTNEEEQYCEEWFKKTTRKANDGRFIVQLPLKGALNNLCSNYTIAESRLKAMERKFDRDPGFKKLYVLFMEEYEKLGHMKQVNGKINKTDYFLPHHGVMKETSTTTKLRVVFDASAKCTNGVSLNNLLRTGPTIQSPLLEILLRFRRYEYVMSGDIEKMYRQVWVDKEDCKNQKILWRRNCDDPIQQFELRTLTYGTAPASFIATRCLMQIAQDNYEKYPEPAEIIMRDMYVDDLMTGANDEKSLIELRDCITEILQSVGFNLRKWSTNSKKLGDLMAADNLDKTIAEENSTKLLGLKWNPESDIFTFPSLFEDHKRHTKRTFLSEASRVFDPLGWLSPVTIKIKILFQSLWLKKIGWDDPLPDDILQNWSKLRSELQEMEKIAIPRWLQMYDEVELHGFCDASELAYSAAVYVKVSSTAKPVHLVAGKTKVSPIKQLSLPRLELMGALLLVSLINVIKKAWTNTRFTRIVLWTDSKIVLDWLAAHPRRWNTFVANRVAIIIEDCPRDLWRHVPSKQNAADCASRGISISEFLSSDSMWWHGPKWLWMDEELWPEQRQSYKTEHEVRCKVIDVLHTSSDDFLGEFILRYNSWGKMKRILAIIQRFVQKLKMRTLQRKSSIVPTNLSGLQGDEMKPISIGELLSAEIKLLQHAQTTDFPNEMSRMNNNKEIQNASSLKSLNPFLDNDGLIRVGGRIDHSMASFQAKHPVILSANNPVSKAIALDLHIQWLHPGSGQLVSLIRQQYWILRARNLAKMVVHNCVRCIRYRPNLEQQIMGDLPADRVTYKHPFWKVGIDYCGPFKIHVARRRGQAPIKAYVCIFVCLSTKAVHIELTTELSTKCFMGALKRFISRRGLCSRIFSDNGSNFIGANNQLRELYTFLKSASNEIQHELAKNEIQWHFNPPSAPHMGGLWESAVKSMKAHLKKVVGENILTYEEFLTLLCQIEAIMNSRPICSIGADEIDVLTPAHFLIGRRLTELPEKNITEATVSFAARWEMMTKMKQHFKKRWQQDYLTSLQRRDRWLNKKENLNVDDIVIISEDNLPATSWSIGRVIDIHPGPDKMVRTVTIKTANNVIKRPIHKLCRLPIHQDVESNDSRRPGCSS